VQLLHRYLTVLSTDPTHAQLPLVARFGKTIDLVEVEAGTANFSSTGSLSCCGFQTGNRIASELDVRYKRK
jgi:hypothetical protein